MLLAFRFERFYALGHASFSICQGAYSILRPCLISGGRALIFTGVRSISESFALVVGGFTLLRGAVLYIFRGLALFFKGRCSIFSGALLYVFRGPILS